jgi:hypothetical protein
MPLEFSRILIKCHCKRVRKGNLHATPFVINGRRSQIGDESLDFCHAGVANGRAIA